MAQIRNVVFIGETGSGKSSVINLITDRDCAVVSRDAEPCTTGFNPHEVLIGERTYRLWDTPGWNEPLSVFNKLFRLKQSFWDSINKFLQDKIRRGELDLLVFCVRGSRAHGVMSKAYSTFCSVARQSAVPVVIAITHLERQQPAMEAWWENNEGALSDLQLVFDNHACITCLSSNQHRLASQQKIRELISRDYQ